MAYIYGQSGAEKVLLRKCSPEISNFQDIKISLEKHQCELQNERIFFFKMLPDRVKKEKKDLDYFKNTERETEDFWNDKMNRIKKNIADTKLLIKNEYKFYLIFLLPIKYIDKFIKNRISKPSEMKKIWQRIDIQNYLINLLENKPESVFENEQKMLINNINHLKRNISSTDYSGAYGETQVLNELNMLSDNYHILCDVNVSLKDYIRYRGNRNLKSAQMDFVVVGPTGIFLIEVKNWGLNHNQFTGINPHEQVDRAGLVLWVYLKQHSFFFKPRITKVLVPIQHNLQYNPYYKSVLIRNTSGLRQFICKNNNILSDSEIKKVVYLLNRKI